MDELGSIRGLIEDASRDTVLWLQANPSAEERAHVLGMQYRLADLDRIIARRVERRTSPKDGRQWSETAREVLSLLEKAREVRGNIVGKGLARLAERLPRELPGRQPPRVSQAPAPPTPLRGGWMPREQSDKKLKIPNTDTRIGRNINILRKECGWSFDELAKKTLIDKKSILSHVNKGARPIPRILKEYAQAFSKELGRRITAPDLEK